jgi:hypothetical protein
MGFRSRPFLSSVCLVLSCIFGLVAIFLSTAHLIQFHHGEIIMPWHFPLNAIIPFVLTGGFLFLAVYFTPEWLWTVTMYVAVFTSGIYVLRFSVFDEWLCFMLVLGGALAAFVGKVQRCAVLKARTWVSLFYTYVSFLLFSSVMGTILYQLKAIRFTVVYAIIMGFVYLFSRYTFKKPSFDQCVSHLCVLSIVYYILYFLHGYYLFFNQYFTAVLEGIGFAGSGYQTVIQILALPAAFIAVHYVRHRGIALLGYLSLILGSVLAVLADSRGSMLAIFVSWFVSLFAFGIKKSIKLSVVAFVAISIAGSIIFQNPAYVLDTFDSIVNTFNVKSGSQTYVYYGEEVTAAEGDGGRFLLVRTAVEGLLDQNPFVILFGSGSYGYFRVAGPYYDLVAKKFGIVDSTPNQGSGGEPPRPPALAATIVETGLIGMMLLISCFAVILRIAFVRENGSRLAVGVNLMLGVPIVLTAAWSYFGEIQDIMMVYFIIMPFGLMHHLIRSHFESKISNLPKG